MSHDLNDAIRTILGASADALEVNISNPIESLFVHTLTNYARAKQESLNVLRVVSSATDASTEEDVRQHFETLARICFNRISPEQITAIYKAVLADQQTLAGD